jgi:alpha-glucosidase
MTDWTSRDLKVSLGFLPAGEYKMIVWKDGINADKNAKDFKMETVTVNNKTELTLNLAKGGGYVARIIKK